MLEELSRCGAHRKGMLKRRWTFKWCLNGTHLIIETWMDYTRCKILEHRVRKKGEFQVSNFLNIWPWESHLTPLVLIFSHIKKEDNYTSPIFLIGLLWGLNENIHNHRTLKLHKAVQVSRIFMILQYNASPPTTTWTVRVGGDLTPTKQGATHQCMASPLT